MQHLQRQTNNLLWLIKLNYQSNQVLYNSGSTLTLSLFTNDITHLSFSHATIFRPPQCPCQSILTQALQSPREEASHKPLIYCIQIDLWFVPLIYSRVQQTSVVTDSVEAILLVLVYVKSKIVVQNIWMDDLTSVMAPGVPFKG